MNQSTYHSWCVLFNHVSKRLSSIEAFLVQWNDSDMNGAFCNIVEQEVHKVWRVLQGSSLHTFVVINGDLSYCCGPISLAILLWSPLRHFCPENCCWIFYHCWIIFCNIQTALSLCHNNHESLKRNLKTLSSFSCSVWILQVVLSMSNACKCWVVAMWLTDICIEQLSNKVTNFTTHRPEELLAWSVSIVNCISSRYACTNPSHV